MEKWRRIWREALVPLLSRTALVSLKTALIRDDSRLVQGRITSPAPMHAVRDRPVECACAIGYCGWQGEGLSSVGQVEAYFHRICEAADGVFNEPAACRYFLNWFDDVPRTRMRRELLAEVKLALGQRVAAA